MSHISRIKTQMVDEEFLTQALDELGYQWEAGDVKIRGVGQAQSQARIKVRFGSGVFKREVGFVKRGKAFEMVADWWGVASGEREKFVQQVYQRYAYHAALSKLEAQGFDLVREENEQNGQIRLVLRRVVS